MRPFAIAVLALSLAASGALAQTAPAPAGPPRTPAVATPDTKNPGAPVSGANSFTEGQAKSRIEQSGFTNVTDLKKDANGIWTGKAVKDGKTSTISLDYQGNVVAR
jgi:hypothetical protein